MKSKGYLRKEITLFAFVATFVATFFNSIARVTSHLFCKFVADSLNSGAGGVTAVGTNLAQARRAEAPERNRLPQSLHLN